jgi:hypothetical protein
MIIRHKTGNAAITYIPKAVMYLHFDFVMLNVLGLCKDTKAKVKQSLYRPRFQNNRHMKVVRLSALRTSCLYPPGIFLVLIYVRG